MQEFKKARFVWVSPWLAWLKIRDYGICRAELTYKVRVILRIGARRPFFGWCCQESLDLHDTKPLGKENAAYRH